jgi:hypothetical protein
MVQLGEHGKRQQQVKFFLFDLIVREKEERTGGLQFENNR